MTWIGWSITLLAWLAIGLGVAYLFGRFVGGVKAIEKAKRPPAIGMWYLRRISRNQIASPTPPFPHTLSRQEIGGPTLS